MRLDSSQSLMGDYFVTALERTSVFDPTESADPVSRKVRKGATADLTGCPRNDAFAPIPAVRLTTIGWLKSPLLRHSAFAFGTALSAPKAADNSDPPLFLDAHIGPITATGVRTRRGSGMPVLSNFANCSAGIGRLK
jgi:hypothetical protein